MAGMVAARSDSHAMGEEFPVAASILTGTAAPAAAKALEESEERREPSELPTEAETQSELQASARTSEVELP